jgi:hypothetical protein
MDPTEALLAAVRAEREAHQLAQRIWDAGHRAITLATARRQHQDAQRARDAAADVWMASLGELCSHEWLSHGDGPKASCRVCGAVTTFVQGGPVVAS